VYNEKDKDVFEFWKHFEGHDASFSSWPNGVPEVSADDGSDGAWEAATVTRMFHLSDASGEMVFTEVHPTKPGYFLRSMLKTDDVMVFDSGNEVFVWVGKGASKDEKREAMGRAAEYMKKNNRPPQLPITKLLEGCDSKSFNSFFTG
jgi:hypothetical protein